MDKVMSKSKQASWKNFGKPDEVREFPKGRLELINIGGAVIGRGIFEPGWRWATSVQPLVTIPVHIDPPIPEHIDPPIPAMLTHPLLESGLTFRRY